MPTMSKRYLRPSCQDIEVVYRFLFTTNTNWGLKGFFPQELNPFVKFLR